MIHICPTCDVSWSCEDSEEPCGNAPTLNCKEHLIIGWTYDDRTVFKDRDGAQLLTVHRRKGVTPINTAALQMVINSGIVNEGNENWQRVWRALEAADGEPTLVSSAVAN